MGISYGNKQDPGYTKEWPQEKWITVKLSSKAKDELIGAEYGSYEDNIREPRDKSEPPHNDPACLHIVELCERDTRKTRVVLKSQYEVEEFFGSMASGTFGLYCPTTAKRLWKELAPHVPEDLRSRWPLRTVCY